jgi:Dual specificity phosphatase, catalytic domain
MDNAQERQRFQAKRGDFKMGFLFLLLGLACVVLAFLAESLVGKFIAFSSAFAFSGMATAYAFSWPGLIGKRRDGCLLPSSYLLFWPFHILNYVSLTLFRLSGQSAPFTEILPGLYLGSRLTPGDARRLFERKISAVLDLTSEFSEVRSLREVAAYMCIPLLDRTAPSPAELDAAICFMHEQTRRGPVYVHCALGHGRSATVVLAYLLASGKFANLNDALGHIQTKRPRVRLNPSQLRALQEFAA